MGPCTYSDLQLGLFASHVLAFIFHVGTKIYLVDLNMNFLTLHCSLLWIPIILTCMTFYFDQFTVLSVIVGCLLFPQ